MMIQTPSEVAAAASAQARGAAQQARDLAQMQRDVAQSQREAAQAARDAARDARDAARAGQDASPVVITITKDGKTVTIDNASPEAAATALGIPLPGRSQDVDPGPYIVGGIAITSGALIVILGFRYLFKWKMRTAAPTALPNDVADRLARMEAGIESVAVEVERISEGQRFTTRLLSERAPVEVPRG
jgi:type II secretory pathway pseudopilin PulG